MFKYLKKKIKLIKKNRKKYLQATIKIQIGFEKFGILFIKKLKK